MWLVDKAHGETPRQEPEWPEWRIWPWGPVLAAFYPAECPEERPGMDYCQTPYHYVVLPQP